MVIDQSFWHGKKILLTGHTGFKGGWLGLWLSHLGANVIGYSLAPSSNPNFYEATQLSQRLISIIHDIRDADNLTKIIKQYKPEIIFHLAAQSLVRASYKNPLETYSTNVMGTVHVLEAARQNDSVRAVINVTTDKCYVNHEWVWGYRENDPLGGADPYSNSKACSELVTEAYRNSFFKDPFQKGIASARAGNVIGGGDWSEDRLIPDIIRAHFTNQPIVIRYPDAIRPWQHVLESLSGYLLLAQSLYKNPDLFSEAWNFGPEQSDIQTVRWVIDRMRDLLNVTVDWKLTNSKQPHEATLLKLDSAKAKTQLKWQPRWSLEKSLEQTLNWYAAYYAKEEMSNFSLKQINLYSTNQIEPFYTTMESVEHV